MERAGTVIARWKGSPASVPLKELARASWRVAVGKRIAGHTTDVEIVRKHLIVSVDDHIWRRQLWGLREQLLENLAKALGAGIVEELEIRVAPRRIGPGRAGTAAGAGSDEADRIGDPMLRRLYKVSRKGASA